jgi:hypothetical protein
VRQDGLTQHAVWNDVCTRSAGDHNAHLAYALASRKTAGLSWQQVQSQLHKHQLSSGSAWVCLVMRWSWKVWTLLVLWCWHLRGCGSEEPA